MHLDSESLGTNHRREQVDERSHGERRCDDFQKFLAGFHAQLRSAVMSAAKNTKPNAMTIMVPPSALVENVRAEVERDEPQQTNEKPCDHRLETSPGSCRTLARAPKMTRRQVPAAGPAVVGTKVARVHDMLAGHSCKADAAVKSLRFAAVQVDSTVWPARLNCTTQAPTLRNARQTPPRCADPLRRKTSRVGQGRGR
jgi:hypothetical protein